MQGRTQMKAPKIFENSVAIHRSEFAKRGFGPYPRWEFEVCYPSYLTIGGWSRKTLDLTTRFGKIGVKRQAIWECR